MTSTNDKGALCPACERFIGPADVCPYCDTESVGRPVLRYLRYAAVLLSIVGLGFLHQMAIRREPDTIKVCDIAPTMNFAMIRIIGTVERDAYIDRNVEGEATYLSFSLHDGSGALRVVAYRDVADDCVDGNMVPRRGMVAEVVGSLSVSAGGKTRMVLDDISRLRLVKQ